MNIQEIKKKLNEITNAVIQDMQLGIEHETYCFHYTSISTLTNILKNNEWWLSHINFVNDPNEYSFGFKVLINLLKQSKISKLLDDPYFYGLGDFHKLKTDPLFVLSFSGCKDFINQWVSYGDNGSGVSIKFDQGNIREKFSEGDFEFSSFFPIHYYDDSYLLENERLKDFESNLVLFFDLIYEKINQKNLINGELKKFIADYLMIWASTIKHNFYESEKEYRLVIKPKNNFNAIQTEIIDDLPKVVYKMNVEKTLGKLIFGVKIGPKHKNDERIKYAVDIAIKNSVLRNIELDCSSGFMR